MTAFSPGIVDSCFELLDIVSRQHLPFPAIRTSFSRIGVMPVGVALDCAQHLKWIQTDDEGCAAVTESGARLMAINKPEARLRQALMDFIDIENPLWIQNASFGRKRLMRFVSTAIRQLFVESGLAEGETHDVIAFWDTLSARAIGQRDAHLLSIGREGERLTFEYEWKRTGRRPKWVAIDNNQDGYDILSIVDAHDGSPLTIEVKSTRIGFEGFLHLTRNEWDRTHGPVKHVFHLWDLSLSSPMLSVIAPNEMERHIPVNRGLGEWEDARIPFAAVQQMEMESPSREP